MRVEAVKLGSIVKTVGLKGEVKLLPSPDFWTEALNAGHLEVISRDGIHSAVRVERYRIKGNTYILKLSEVGTIEEAEPLVNGELMVSTGDVEGINRPRELKPFQVIGVQVYLADGTGVGEVVDMLLGSVQNYLIVEEDGERLIIPNVPEIIYKVDLEKGVIYIDPPEGLLDLRW
ncbi:MAG: 16S rRNA processing protein RimM [Candidatus Krumholzibacteriota bacterium]|nr:16S rRNA processing protein RimM [Candidatus Krumholzibacteriota bacterium]